MLSIKLHKFELGYALFEQSIALIVLITLLAGSADLLHYIHASSVLADGAEAIASEYSKLAGQAVSANLQSSQRSFNWYRFRWNAAQHTGVRQLVASALPEGVIPAGCYDSTTTEKCEARVISSSTAGQRKISFTSSQNLNQLALQQIHSGLPNAKLNCTDAECITIESSFFPQSNDPADYQEVRVNISYHMPLYLLGRTSVSIHSNITRKLENKMVSSDLDMALLNPCDEPGLCP